jgi:hypothetical protein
MITLQLVLFITGDFLSGYPDFKNRQVDFRHLNYNMLKSKKVVTLFGQNSRTISLFSRQSVQK